MKLKNKNKNIDEMLTLLGYDNIDDFSDEDLQEIYHHIRKNATLILENGQELLDVWMEIIK